MLLLINCCLEGEVNQLFLGGLVGRFDGARERGFHQLTVCLITPDKIKCRLFELVRVENVKLRLTPVIADTYHTLLDPSAGGWRRR